MKKITLTFCAATMLLLACNNGGGDDKAKTDSTGTTVSEVKKDAPPATLPDSATMMKNWQSYMTPGEMQTMMASWNGTWDADITMWEPGKPEQKSKGTTVNKMVMGGRYQESIHTSTMMGMPFEGHGTLGYDNAKKVFESVWIDNMGSGVTKMTGPWDAATKSVTLLGKMIDPSTLKEIDHKETFKVIDDNTQQIAMYGPGPDGKEFKMMEIKFTRKK